MVSNGEGTTFSQPEWQHYAEKFASDQSNVKVVYIDSPRPLSLSKKAMRLLLGLEKF